MLDVVVPIYMLIHVWWSSVDFLSLFTSIIDDARSNIWWRKSFNFNIFFASLIQLIWIILFILALILNCECCEVSMVVSNMVFNGEHFFNDFLCRYNGFNGKFFNGNNMVLMASILFDCNTIVLIVSDG